MALTAKDPAQAPKSSVSQVGKDEHGKAFFKPVGAAAPKPAKKEKVEEPVKEEEKKEE